jgi:hypothetical protein
MSSKPCTPRIASGVAQTPRMLNRALLWACRGDRARMVAEQQGTEADPKKIRKHVE